MYAVPHRVCTYHITISRVGQFSLIFLSPADFITSCKLQMTKADADSIRNTNLSVLYIYVSFICGTYTEIA